MTKSLLAFFGNDPQYLALAWHIARTARNSGDDIAFLDLSETAAGFGDAYNRRLLKLGRRSAPNRLFIDLVKNDGFEVIEPKAPEAPENGDLPDEASEGIAESVHSALVSFARDPLPRTRNRAGIWARLERSLDRTARATYRVVAAILDADPTVQSIYVPNGRFPYQRAVIEAAKASRRPVVYYEKGDRTDSYWLEDHSTLDRERTQGSVDSVLASLSGTDAAQVGRDWMNGRARPGNVSNIYSRFFSDELDESAPTSTSHTVVGLFTSSQDEFAALGPEWHVQSWHDQWQAFDHVLSHLESAGYDFYLRVHPNFTTKSHASFVRERESVLELQRRHPSLTVIWHDEQVNSYALIGETDIVVVWDSTIGLEASGRGVPVWELAASYYDLYADVREWFGPEQDPDPDALKYGVDVERAQRFMAYMVLRDSDLPDDAVAIRNSLTPASGLATRMASLTASGGAPTPAIAISSIIDAARHRRFAINRMAARSLVGSGKSRDTP